MSDSDHTTPRERATIFVESATRIMTAALVRNLGMAEDQALEIARNAVHDVCAEHPRQLLYISADQQHTRTNRDRDIYSRYNGRNVHQLASQYGITHVRVEQIHKRMLNLERASRQGMLPGI